MKLLPLCAVAVSLGATTVHALDFVRQIQVLDGKTVVTDHGVSSTEGQSVSGSVRSTAMTASLSVFQLWADYNDPNAGTSMVKLDEKSIGTYLPQVTITTASADPHVPTRTRADQPYSMTVKVSGLMNDPSYPDYARAIAFQRGYKEYSPVNYAPTGTVGVYPDSAAFLANGTFTTTSIYQQLPGSTATGAVGAETFTASIRPEANLSIGALAQAEIIVWPVGAATIAGIVSGERYLGMPRNGVVTLTNAYPKSTTYAQLYKGPQKLGTVGEVVPNSTVTYSADVPQNTTIAGLDLEALSSKFPDDGLHTLEILTVTPFNGGAPERLAYVTFKLKRTLSVEAMVSTIN